MTRKEPPHAAPPLKRCDYHTGIEDDEYTHDELEFMRAMDQYKREKCRPYPKWTEVLGVLVSLGYRKPPPETLGLTQTTIELNPLAVLALKRGVCCRCGEGQLREDLPTNKQRR